MNNIILDRLSSLKKQLSSDGFMFTGVFGSYVRNENREDSDIDILYNLTLDFRNKYKGFKAIAKLDDIQETISDNLGIKADLVQQATLSSNSKKYILAETIYVD